MTNWPQLHRATRRDSSGDRATWRDPRLGASREVESPSGTIRYHEVGVGPVLVFVHGYLVNANIWRKLVPLLANEATAAHPATYRSLYQVLRIRRTWRWRNTYGWLAQNPIDTEAMESYIRPVLDNPAVRYDGRKAIGSVSAKYSRTAAEQLTREWDKPILLAWAAEDHVFPLVNAQRYADRLRPRLETIAGSYTYTSEDQPVATARILRTWMNDRPG